MSDALILFVKNPELGKVKTRLAASVGNQQAMQIYLQLLSHTRNVGAEVQAERYVYYSSFIDQNDDWITNTFHKKLQQGDDLGERMKAAFKEAFNSHSRVVIIGSDCKELTSQVVKQAFTKLEQFEFVVGPATDGGYFLLGMRNFHPEVFDDVEWSSGNTLDQTLGKMIGDGKPVFLLPELSDVDYLEDWEKVK